MDRCCKQARSMASAFSNSAIRARQMPSPYFGRSNINKLDRGKRMAPDLQDQIRPLQFFEQPNRGIAIDLNDGDRVRIAADVRKQVDGGGAQAKCADGR